MALVMHMEPVIGGMVLQVSDEASDVDHSHTRPACHDDGVDLHAVLNDAAEAIRSALGSIDNWGLADTKPGQYLSDLAADAAALEVLIGNGLGVLSEETGRHHPERDITVVLDPLDGSTNASRGIPWYAISMCAVDHDGPRAALVVNLAQGPSFRAERGAGATADDLRLIPSRRTAMNQSLVALSGYPREYLGWYQFRALGAAALDLCAVAAGVVDAYIDCSWNAHGPWDYLGGALVCREAGAFVVDAQNRDLVTLEYTERRTPVAAGTQPLLEEALAARRALER
ncbi:MAG: monophosphatase [Acidimicrobiaceae bacterium]|jgi:fructose-1,6-bisphosphatase/inositol monophosphatase family enzyme